MTLNAQLPWRISAGGPPDIRADVWRITSGPMIVPSGHDGPAADVRRMSARVNEPLANVREGSIM
jgi:hypothetical protein